ncbi:MAG: caspase family protein [Oscillatoria sp. PMC 1051.18]|nr:caspase family protein [Oscillatoria sp. PMC 1050.18]MEC5028372.1 caspase family protein [Oscillatoria sp. PMC 1051.18]
MADMGLDRRTFLQRATLALLTLGISETGLLFSSKASWAAPSVLEYLRNLTQPDARKLALLVGINEYPSSNNLRGCLTDVELQRELLIHRFGFHPSDILTLTNQQATREEIETAFREHLGKQAKANDVVVFHFSGYGNQVKIKSPGSEQKLNEEQPENTEILANSLVPVDGIAAKSNGQVDDLLEESLFLLARSLATEKLTTILDTSYTGSGKTLLGNLRVRSCPKPPAAQPSEAELAFQAKLLAELNFSETQLQSKNIFARIPGIILKAARNNQLATEAELDGFSAGLFTYALTQYLWQVTPASTVYITLQRASEVIERIIGTQQQPQLAGKNSNDPAILTYYLPPTQEMGAEAVITKVEEDGKTAKLHLGGLPAKVMQYYGSSSRFLIVPTFTETEAEIPSVELQLSSRTGLTAKAKLVEKTVPEGYQLQNGQLLQEAIRVLPRNIGLTVALGSAMERIERVDATSAFANIDLVSSVVTAGEQSADCLFGRANTITKTAKKNGAEPLPKKGYGLYTVGGVSIPNTAGSDTEAVKSAVDRLVPKLQTLLAAKLLRLTANEASSRLGVRASLIRVNSENVELIRRETRRDPSLRASLAIESEQAEELLEANSQAWETQELLPSIPIGSQIQFQLENISEIPVYMMLMGIDSGGNAIGLYSPESSSEDSTTIKPKLINTVIPPGEKIVIPRPSASFKLAVPGPAGLAEIQLVFSKSPFNRTLSAIGESRPPRRGEGERIIDLSNPLQVARAMMQDLHAASAVPAEAIGSATDIYAFDVNAWATLSFFYLAV